MAGEQARYAPRKLKNAPDAAVFRLRLSSSTSSSSNSSSASPFARDLVPFVTETLRVRPVGLALFSADIVVEAGETVLFC